MSFEELSKDLGFKKKIENARDINQVIGYFKEKGIEVTEEQLVAAANMAKDRELSEADMESIAGGGLINKLFGNIRLSDVFRRDERNWFNKYLNNLENITRGNF